MSSGLNRRVKIDSDSEGEDDVAGGVLSGAGGKLGGSLTNVSSVDWESELPAKQQQVQRALSSSDYKTALRTALDNPPLGKVAQETKDKYSKLIVETLCNIRLLDLVPVLKTLTDDAQLLDTCLKYVYRGMASPELYNSASLLAIHEKLVELNGIGGIVRILSDRRTA